MTLEVPSESEEKPKRVSVIKYVTASDRMNEPPPQPRVRKVTTVINTLGVIIRKTSTEIGVWVMTACKETVFPYFKGNSPNNFEVGKWLIVGIYPDGSIASFSPCQSILNVFETKVVNGNVCLKVPSSEFHHERTITYNEVMMSYIKTPYYVYPHCDPSLVADLWNIHGFGRVLLPTNLRPNEESRTYCIQYCSEPIVGGACNWVYTGAEFKNLNDFGFSEKELKDVGEFMRKREVVYDQSPGQSIFVARHFGFIVESNKSRSTLSCWSPKVPMEADHVAQVPKPPKSKEPIQCSMIPPLVGQWIQFDVGAKDQKKYMETVVGYKLNITEFLPVNSPVGVGTAYMNRLIRTVVSCILVKGTNHPLIYDLPIFGLVLSKKGSLVSGTYMQLVLEKTNPRTRRLSGICWKVHEASEVNPNDEKSVDKTGEMRIETVPLRDSMETTKFVQIIEKSSFSKSTTPTSQNGSAPTSIVANLKLQNSSQKFTDNRRREAFLGHNFQIQNYNGRNEKMSNYKRPTFTGEKMQCRCIVEKITSLRNAGILWNFNENLNVHFFYDELLMSPGDYGFAELIQKEDSTSINGFRWKLLAWTQLQTPFVTKYDSIAREVSLEVEMSLTGNAFRGYLEFKSQDFPRILDPHNLIKNPQNGYSYITMIAHKRTGEFTSFNWIVVGHNQSLRRPLKQAPSCAILHRQDLRFMMPSRGDYPMDTSRPPSDLSTTSKCTSIPSD